MKFVEKSEDEFIIVKFNSDVIPLDEVLVKFRKFCLACGYQPYNVDRIIYLEENEEVVDKEDSDGE